MKSININRTANVVGDYDVVVCGGGPAGWVAATAAARNGCRTALIDRYGFLGGTATGGLVVPISGYYVNAERVVGGIAWELVQALIAVGAAKVELPYGHVSVDTEYYKLFAQRMVLDAGVDFYSNSYISGVCAEKNKVTAVYFENKNGTEALTGRYFIDATGDGDVCAFAGLPMRLAKTLQPLSFCFELTGVDATTPLLRDCIHHDGKNGNASCNVVIRKFLNEKHDAGEGPMFGGPWFNTLLNGDRLAVNVTRSPASILDNRAYMKAECQMREDIFTIVGLLKKEYPEFRDCVISSTAVNAGARESRHLVGLHTLTGDEVINAFEFPDSIARIAHPVDIHKPDSSGQTLIMLKKGGYIPYRSLVSKEGPNLIAAGRFIDADPTAHATLRVQATAMATGEAAGNAAALCARDGRAVFETDTDELRGRLLSAGAIL